MRFWIGFAVGLAGIVAAGTRTDAQIALPAPKPPSGEDLFKRQCAACHTVKAADAPRQGPTLEGVFGRKAGSVEGFRYSAGFAKTDWAWDDAHLDAWLDNPQAVIPGAIMPYRQGKADVRKALIGYLKDLH